MKKILRAVAVFFGVLLLLLLIGPLLVPIPPLNDTVSIRMLAEESSQFLTLPYPGTEGLELHYWEDGAGERSFLLLHGFSGNLYAWDELFPYFSRQGKTLAYDRTAFGLSARPMPGEWQGPNPYSQEAAVSQAVTFLDEFGIESAVLVGHSAGGTLALQIALAHPERVEALILAAPAVYSGSGAPPFIQTLANTPQLRRIGPLFARILGELEYPEAFTAVQRERAALGTRVDNWDVALWEFTAASSLPNLPGRLTQITQPVLVLSGDEDETIPVSESIRLAEELPNAELALLPGCGHALQQACDSGFLAAVEKWLPTLEEE